MSNTNNKIVGGFTDLKKNLTTIATWASRTAIGLSVGFSWHCRIIKHVRQRRKQVVETVCSLTCHHIFAAYSSRGRSPAESSLCFSFGAKVNKQLSSSAFEQKFSACNLTYTIKKVVRWKHFHLTAFSRFYVSYHQWFTSYFTNHFCLLYRKNALPSTKLMPLA